MEGLIDSHCHPTENKQYMHNVKNMKAGCLVAMSTSFEDINLVCELADTYSDKVIPAFGYHPWFAHLVKFEEDELNDEEHYKKVIKPEPDAEFINKLPKPQLFNDYLKQIKSNLNKYSNAIVGELGIDRAFRLPNKNPKPGEPNLTVYQVNTEHQERIFKAQLQLAAEMNKPISIHSVQAHGLVFGILTNMNPPPPSICLHSYNGAPEMIKQYLVTTKNNRKPKLNAFVSCSVLINIAHEKKAEKLLNALPFDKVLTESDYSTAGEQMDEYLQQSFDTLCKHYNWDDDRAQAKSQIEQNFNRFLMRN